MGQEEEDLPQPDPLCRHLRVSVLACLPVSCRITQKSAASNCICTPYVHAYILLCVQCDFGAYLMWRRSLFKRQDWVCRHSSSSHTHSSSAHTYSPALCRAYITAFPVDAPSMCAIHCASATMRKRNLVGAMCNGIWPVENLCARADLTSAVVTQS